MTNVVDFSGRASPPPRPAKRRPRVDETKAMCAVAGFELAESAIRSSLVEFLPFSGVKLTADEIAKLRACADFIEIMAAKIEGQLMPEVA